MESSVRVCVDFYRKQYNYTHFSWLKGIETSLFVAYSKLFLSKAYMNNATDKVISFRLNFTNMITCFTCGPIQPRASFFERDLTFLCNSFNNVRDTTS